MLLAFFERGPVAKSTRAELQGDECDEYIERCFRHLEAHSTGVKNGRLFAEIVDRKTTQSPLCLRKLAVTRPTCSQTETSSRAANDVSIALKCCTSQIPLTKRLAESTTLLSRVT